MRHSPSPRKTREIDCDFMDRVKNKKIAFDAICEALDAGKENGLDNRDLIEVMVKAMEVKITT